MSDDLISRKAVIELIENKRLNVGKDELSKEYLLADLQDDVEKMQTAYDMDKVVEQLDKASDYYECEEQGREHVQMVDLTEAIEIVKEGGVSE